MEHSRVKKFKKYRESFTKMDAQDIGDANNIMGGFANDRTYSNTNTTNTLPYDEVLQKVGDEDAKDSAYKKKLIKKYCKIGLFCLLGVAIVVGIVILGILAFRG